ncbi:MAG: tol-pal system protein YbgF [Desulfobacteraceae bacterium]|nr:tol-pal system protein YbgF [Desulfobacteraceae bacterium]
MQQDIVVLEDRLGTLEQQNQLLKRQNELLNQQLQDELKVIGRSTKSGDKSLRSQYATTNADIRILQKQSQIANGRFEELEYSINRKFKSVEKLQKRMNKTELAIAKLNKKFVQVDSYLNLERPGKGNAAGKGEDKSDNSENRLYDKAKQSYDNGDMDKARQRFKQLIEDYPKSDQADNAQFWIGESYYREKWYEKAILEYQTVIEKYPKGNKVPAAMLKQALAFLKLGDKANSRLRLKELTKKFPNSSEARIAAQKLKEF